MSWSILPVKNHPSSRRSTRAVNTIPVLVKPSQSKNTWEPSLPIWVGLILVGMMLLLSLAAIVGFYAYYQYTGRIYPGVRLAGEDLGGKTLDEAAQWLDQRWNAQPALLVTNGITSQAISPNALGISVNALATAQRAHEIGHGSHPLDEFMRMLVCLVNGWEVQPVVTFDHEQALRGLENLNAILSQPPQDARLHIENGTITAIPAEIGYAINLEKSLERLENEYLTVISQGFFQVDLKPVLPEIASVDSLVAEAEQLIRTPIEVSAYDAIRDQWYTFTLNQNELAALLKAEADGSRVFLSLDAQSTLSILRTWNIQLPGDSYLDSPENAALLAEAVSQGSAPRLLVRHYPTTYTVQPGDTLLKIGWNLGFPYWMILQANPGLDPNNVWAGITLNIPSKDDLLPLPIVFGKRIRISISKQRLWVYENSKEIGKYVISTGIDRSPTQPGVFQVQTHEEMAYASVWNLYMPHFIGIYEAWPGFMNGIHGLPILSNGQRLWANILGKPASYGCIIMDVQPAEWLYYWAENGVVVEIIP